MSFFIFECDDFLFTIELRMDPLLYGSSENNLDLP